MNCAPATTRPDPRPFADDGGGPGRAAAQRVLGDGAALLEASPCPMLVVDDEGGIVFANAHAARTWGRPSSSLAGTKLQEHLAPESRGSLQSDLLAAIGAPAGSRAEVRRELVGIRADGERFPIELAMGPFGPAAGAMGVVVARDLSEQKTAERMRERLEVLLEFAPAFILVVDRHGTIDFINRTIAPYTKETTIGTPWLQYFPPERHGVLTDALASVFEKGVPEVYEVRMDMPTGETRCFESHIAPVRVGGEIVAGVVVSQDVTEPRRTQAELLAGRHMALLGTLASGVAHEINTPVQFVGDSIEFLSETSRDLFDMIDRLQALRQAALAGARLEDTIAAAKLAEQAADLPFLRDNVPKAFVRCIEGLHQVARIVRSLKDYAHPAAPEMAPADLNRAVENGITIATNEYKYVADLRLELGELPLVTCHASEIGQAVVNIVVNAAHAIEDVVRGTDRRGVITVRTWSEGEMAVIAVGDTGGGIPESIRPRIFDPFFTTKEVGKGTGQGLAIAWSTVKERHGGQLTFESRMGQGSTFFIRLPIAGKPCDRGEVGPGR